MVIPENVTIHRATKESTYTTIGSGCMLQSRSHVDDDCLIMDNTTLANCSMLGGHSIVGNHCSIYERDYKKKNPKTLDDMPK